MAAADGAAPKEDGPEPVTLPVYAIRHAESVANMVKKRDLKEYYRLAWLDDSEKEQSERLRDTVLTQEGAVATMQRVTSLAAEMPPGGPVLVIVSPLTRTLMTASLLFSLHLEAELAGTGGAVHVVVEPAVIEVINAKHDLVENIGRQPVEAFAEAETFLEQLQAPKSALALLGRCKEAMASAGLGHDWWHYHLEPGELPKRALESGAPDRRLRIRAAVRKHIKANPTVTKVFIVCHWGTVHTMTGLTTIENLQFVQLNDALNAEG